MDSIISGIQKKEKILLNARQKEGILKAFQYPVTIITGGPGRGKTTDISFIIEVEKILHKKRGDTVVVLANWSCPDEG
ncbi:MAG: AAA family ATPase [Blautia faecis]